MERLDKNEEKQIDIVVAGLNDFKFDRKDIVLKKLRHKKRLVRKHAALSIPYDKKVIFEYYLEGSVDRDFFQNALEESLVHFDRDFRKSNSWLFVSNDSSNYTFRESIIEKEKDWIYGRLEKLKEIKWERAIETSAKQDILDIDIGNKIPESKVKIKDKKPSLKISKTIISFKEWSKKNRDKTFSDYKTEVLGK